MDEELGPKGREKILKESEGKKRTNAEHFFIVLPLFPKKTLFDERRA